MLQIASGMCYFHDMKVAHCDLKPNNVVVTSMDISKSNGCLECVHVKLVDFGLSKIEVKDSSQVPTGQFPNGTFRYMAPEAFKNRSLEVNAFKTDVFSFAMTSFEILSGEKPFGALSHHDYWKSIHDGKRPELPKNCSKELKSLIHDCWSLDPSKRPTFFEICNTLRLLKSAMFKNVISMHEILQHKEPLWSYNMLMNPRQWWINFMEIICNVFCHIVLVWQVFVALSSWLRFMPKIGEYGSSPQDTRNDPSLHQILDKVIVWLILFFSLSNIVCKSYFNLSEINDIESLG
jgi:serine/threonine protein kinase